MGQVLEPVRDFDADSSEGNGMRACFASIQGWRQTQEDDHTVTCDVPGRKGLGFFAVYDGHGGARVSQFASQEVLKQFSQLLADDTVDAKGIGDALKKAIMKTDIALGELNQGYGRDQFLQEGCTAIVCAVTPTHIICANVGDSRAILVSASEEEEAAPNVTPLSEDQKPNNPQEEQRVRDAGMRVINCHGIFRVNGDLAVARALGDFGFKNADLDQDKQAVSCEPEITIVERNKEIPQILCLGCDGIWDVVDNESAGEFIMGNLSKHGEIYTTAARLIDVCLNNGSRDNMSVVLCDLNSKFKLGPKPVYVPPQESEGANGEDGNAAQGDATANGGDGPGSGGAGDAASTESETGSGSGTSTNNE